MSHHHWRTNTLLMMLGKQRDIDVQRDVAHSLVCQLPHQQWLRGKGAEGRGLHLRKVAKLCVHPLEKGLMTVDRELTLFFFY